MSLVHSLKALADTNRMRILTRLISSDLCVGALAAHLDLSKPAVSQHLRILRKAGLVRGEKRGYWTHYVVDTQAIIRIAEEIKTLGVRPRVYETLCWRISELPKKQFRSKEVDMCQNCCQQPDQLQDKQENCSPEQIRKCHEDTQEHPCTQKTCTPEDN